MVTQEEPREPFYLVCQTLSTTCRHQNENITPAHCCINYFSLIWTKGMIPKHLSVVDLYERKILELVPDNRIENNSHCPEEYFKFLRPWKICAAPSLIIWSFNVINFNKLWSEYFPFQIAWCSAKAIRSINGSRTPTLATFCFVIHLGIKPNRIHP